MSARLERALVTLSRPTTHPTLAAAIGSLPPGLRSCYREFVAEWERRRADNDRVIAIVLDIRAWAAANDRPTYEALYLVQRLANTMVQGRFTFDGHQMAGYRPLLQILHVLQEEGKPVYVGISIPEHGEVQAA